MTSHCPSHCHRSGLWRLIVCRCRQEPEEAKGSKKGEQKGDKKEKGKEKETAKAADKTDKSAKPNASKGKGAEGGEDLQSKLSGGLTKSSLAPDPDMVTHLQEALTRYCAIWANWHDQAKNPEQTHDYNLAKAKL